MDVKEDMTLVCKNNQEVESHRVILASAFYNPKIQFTDFHSGKMFQSLQSGKKSKFTHTMEIKFKACLTFNFILSLFSLIFRE